MPFNRKLSCLHSSTSFVTRQLIKPIQPPIGKLSYHCPLPPISYCLPPPLFFAAGSSEGKSISQKTV